MSEPSRLTRFLARSVWATRLVDKAYGKFNTLRTRLVVSWGTDSFHDAFNDVTYASQPSYRPDAATFASELFPWERRVIEAHFPKPPATVLIGGCGGGREALALERRGYRVVAFDPTESLTTALYRMQNGGLGDRGGLGDQSALRKVEVFVGRYQDLPWLKSSNGSRTAIDLRQRPKFDAALMGWASFSHIRSDAERVEALRQMGALTAGPILLSYYSQVDEQTPSSSQRESFAMQVGFFRQLSEAEIRTAITQAGLEIVLLQHDAGWPCAVVREVFTSSDR
jgi:SAM-dependent methyltransferase